MIREHRRPLPLALFALLAVVPPVAEARAEVGTAVENVQLKTITGGSEALLSAKVKANIFVFFRTGQDRSVDALKQMAQCEKDLAGRSIHWAAVVSSSEPIAEVSAVVRESGIVMPVLIDEGDALYSRLGIRLHPMVGIVDARFKIAAMEPYRQIDYCDVIRTQLKILLGESTQADLDRVLNPEASPLPGADPMKKAMRDVNMARRLYEIGQYEKAVKQAQRALEIAPVSQAFVVMGQAYSRLGRCPDAAKSLDQAARLDPRNADVAPARALCSK